MSIRRRLLLIVLLAMLPPTLLVGTRFFQDYRDQIADARAGLTLVAGNLAQNLNEKIQGTSQLLYGLSRAPDLATSDRDACSTFLSAVREEYPLYTGILTIQPDGSLFCDSLMTGRTLDLRDRRYYQEAVGGARGVVLEPVFGRLTGLAVMQIAFPVRAPDGALQRILLASLNVTGFLDANSKKLPLPDTETMIVDRRGKLLAIYPGTEKAKALVDTDISTTDLFRYAGAHPQGGIAEATGPSGIPKVWAVAPIITEHDPGIFIFAGKSKAGLTAPANARLMEDVLQLFALSLFLVGGAWLVAEYSIRRPVNRIATAISRLGHGDLSTRLTPPLPRGELGQLMEAVNIAAQSLESQRADIDSLHGDLRQAQKMEAIGHLTGGIAHDFNNILSVILGNSELLSEELQHDPRLQHLADMSVTATERAAELTRSLLAFARKQPLDPRSVDINDLLLRMKALLARSLGEQVECEVALAAHAWPALIDPVQLQSAILNLAINARDAMPGGGRLTIETANATLDDDYCHNHAGAAPGDYVVICVSDNGTGMTDEVMAKAFDPFFTTKDVGKGSGLGLSMVYGFVKQSNGYIRIYSEINHGTTVKLYLPSPDHVHIPTQSIAATAIIRGQGETILVVEDNDIVRDHVVGLLTGLGYRTIAAQDGGEAITILRGTTAIDLLFTDIVMPGGVSGVDLAREAAVLRPGLKVLYTSGYAENAIVHDGRLDAGVQFLSKPYRRQELSSKLHHVLTRPPAESTPHA